MGDRRRIGIILFQLGGPDSLEAVRPFLYNLFCDPEILDLPLGWLARRPLAWWIARRRAGVVAEHYREIGGRSPILQLTERQARALEAALAADAEARAVVAMRYWKPFTADAVAELNAFRPGEIVLLPLYPQYSFATTASSLNEWSRQWLDNPAPIHLVESFYDHPGFIAAVAEKINTSLGHFAEPQGVHLVFSAHGLPVSFVQRGDPYQKQVEATVGLVRRHGGWPNAATLCYQSKVGRQKWLEPDLESTIERLAAEGVKDMLVAPIAFVTEHIETLHEINIEARELAEQAGVRQFEMMPALNDSPAFIAALADLVRCAAGAASAVEGHVPEGSKSA